MSSSCPRVTDAAHEAVIGSHTCNAHPVLRDHLRKLPGVLSDPEMSSVYSGSHGVGSPAVVNAVLHIDSLTRAVFRSMDASCIRQAHIVLFVCVFGW